MLPSPDILNEFEAGKFVLSNLAAKRAKQLQEGGVPLVHIDSKHPLTIALAEIAAGKVKAVLPDVSTLPEDIAIPAVEHGRPAEFNVLLPSLDEIEIIPGLDDEEEHESDLDVDHDDVTSITDLVSDEEVDTVVPETDSVSLSDLTEQEALEEDEAEV